MRDYRTLYVRVNKYEGKAIEQMAAERQITISEALRALLHSAMDQRRRERDIEDFLAAKKAAAATAAK